jgi:branched-chain amino acid aminotransferase
MVSVYDHGLLYGDGVFEGIRVYKRQDLQVPAARRSPLPLRREDQASRFPSARRRWSSVQRDCIEANNLTDGYIRLVVTRGYGTLGLDPRRCPVPGVICIADQIAPLQARVLREGHAVVVAKRPKTPVECLDPRIKSLNYLNNILAKVEAIEQGCDEAIMLNTDGYVTECTGDNLFIIKNGKVYTPPVR